MGTFFLGQNKQMVAGLPINRIKALEDRPAATTPDLSGYVPYTGATTNVDLGTNKILFGAGAVGAPGMAFSTDTDTGIYRIGANLLGIASNGVKTVTIDGTDFNTTTAYEADAGFIIDTNNSSAGGNLKGQLLLKNQGNNVFAVIHRPNFNILEFNVGTSADWVRMGGGTSGGTGNRLDISYNSIFLGASDNLGVTTVRGALLVPRLGDASSTATQAGSGSLQLETSLWTGAAQFVPRHVIKIVASTATNNLSRFAFVFNTTGANGFSTPEALSIVYDGTTATKIGIGPTAPTAWLHIKAGTATANTAPLKLTSGTNLTSAEAGAFEYDGTRLYFSPSTTRKAVVIDNGTRLTSGRVPFATTNGELNDSSNLTFAGNTLTTSGLRAGVLYGDSSYASMEVPGYGFGFKVQDDGGGQVSLGFFNEVSTQGTVSGDTEGNVALQNLLQVLDDYGLIINSTT
jgi:hypothetical protein